MHSMTGFGRGEATLEGRRCVAEISSVNRKGLDVNVGLPRHLSALEAQVNRLIREHLHRGHVQVRIAVEDGSGGTILTLDAARVQALKVQADRLADSLSLRPVDDIATYLRFPEVVRVEEETVALDKVWPLVEAAVRVALAGLVEMRQAEGQRLSVHLGELLTRMEEECAAIAERAPASRDAYRQRLVDGLRAGGLADEVGEARLLQEIALFAERADIREELDRLVSHFAEVRERLAGEGRSLGRGLDFLTQEMGREWNTLSVKARDLEITRRTLAAKEALEQFREQVQNIE